MTAFLPNNPIGDKISVSYPSSSPIYNLTAVFTQVTQVLELSRFNLPFCVSILIVQPFNKSQTEVLPYNVTCQTYCTGDSGTQVCQTKRYEVAGKYTIILMSIASKAIAKCLPASSKLVVDK